MIHSRNKDDCFLLHIQWSTFIPQQYCHDKKKKSEKKKKISDWWKEQTEHTVQEDRAMSYLQRGPPEYPEIINTSSMNDSKGCRKWLKGKGLVYDSQYSKDTCECGRTVTGRNSSQRAGSVSITEIEPAEQEEQRDPGARPHTAVLLRIIPHRE